MDELLDDAGPRHRLQVRARLAQLDAVALHLADAETLPDQLVQRNTAHRQLPASPAGCQPDGFDDARFDERQRLAGWGSLLVKVPVALEPLAGHRLHLVDRPELRNALGAQMDRLDRHPG